MQEQKDMTGVLFKNHRKQNDKHPDYTGNATVEGYEYELSAWIKESKKGNKYMKITFQSPKEEQEKQVPVSRELDDDIPF